MTVAIPVWLLWTLGIVGGVIALLILGGLIAFAVVGWVCARSIGRGINW